MTCSGNRFLCENKVKESGMCARLCTLCRVDGRWKGFKACFLKEVAFYEVACGGCCGNSDELLLSDNRNNKHRQFFAFAHGGGNYLLKGLDAWTSGSF